MQVIRGALCAMVGLCAALPASAQLIGPASTQAEDTAAIEKSYGLLATGCLEAHDNRAITQVERQQTCESEVVQLNAYFNARAHPSPHERNMMFMHRGFLLLEASGAMTLQDGARSRRACETLEASWADFTSIVDAGSPAAYQGPFNSLRTAVSQAVQSCRNDFGTPAGSPSLPQ